MFGQLRLRNRNHEEDTPPTAFHSAKSDVAVHRAGDGELHQPNPDTSNSNVSCFCRIANSHVITHADPGLTHGDGYTHADTNANSNTKPNVHTSTHADSNADGISHAGFTGPLEFRSQCIEDQSRLRLALLVGHHAEQDNMGEDDR